MSTQPVTATGTKIYLGPSVAAEPANAAAYAALSWTEIGMVETIGEYGDESSIVSIAILGDGRTRKNKGARDAGTLNLTVAHVTDTGQAAMIAAEATNNNYAVKIVLPNRLNVGGTDEIHYMIGLVTSKRLNVGGNDNIIRRALTLTINSKITEVAPTAA